MSNSSSFYGQCPKPFLDESLFGGGGFIDGRLCSPLTETVSCCIPCPITDWLYPDNIDNATLAVSWINVPSTLCSLFLLASFFVLPVAQTHRHYLSVALTLSIIVMQLGFLVPLGAQPEQCYNEITPNDMHSSIVCALSGSFLLLGGWASLMWVFLRAVALHLQICWQVVIGKKFMWGALGAGFGVPAIGVTIALILSGVSFRFGDTCHINHQSGLADFWIPLLVFCGATLVIQIITFGYCIKVYLSSLKTTSQTSTTNSSTLPSYTTSMRSVSPKQAYRRVSRVIELQWRGICFVLVIVVDVIFFAVVFVWMDTQEQEALHNKTKALPWLECMIAGLGKNYCLRYTGAFILNEATVIAVLLLLSTNGIWALLLLGRISMLKGWYKLISNRLQRNPGMGEFVSMDARAFGSSKRDTKSYEMLDSPGGNDVKEPEPIARRTSHLAIDSLQPLVTDNTFSPSTVATTPVSPLAKVGRQTPDYFGRDARYVSPARSFSAPRPPSASATSPQASPPTSPGRRPPLRSHGHVAWPDMDPLAMNKI